jgi:tRNA modification GTPase
MITKDTIIAIATPPGMGAIAVLRLSGETAIAEVAAVYKGKSGLQKAPGYSLHYGSIMDGSATLDEVVISIFRAPKSYTGEDVVEISCHGSTYIQQALLNLFLQRGVRLAEPGEFSMRSFFNGKMDLSQAEAVADLIHSESAASAKIALQQMRGGFSKELAALRDQLIYFASLIELELDFAEENVEFANREQLQQLLDEIEAVVLRLSSSFALGNAIKNGIPVSIVGAPNAGKSTLLNALLQDERAIVSEIAGTTRDTIEDEMEIDGLRFRFIDTAGLRDTDDAIESIGIRKAYEKIQQAEIVLFLYDATKQPEEIEREYRELCARTEGKSMMVIANKSDLRQVQKPHFIEHPFFHVSAAQQDGLDELQNALVQMVKGSSQIGQEVIVTNARHFQNLDLTLQTIRRIRENMLMGVTGDFLALDVREALRYLGNITGAIEIDRDILGTIFGKFCIGK